MRQNLADKMVVGILAHVDSGKTTLAESILYESGAIRKLGRVDHRDAFLDTHELERSRGITIFAKQALVSIGRMQVTLLDTPGHVDFSAEMERTLQVLDYAILVISGADGVQGHVETLWRLLKRYEVPVFLFINKMDQEGADRERLLAECRRKLDDRCVDFTEAWGTGSGREAFWEALAMCDDDLMEHYLENGGLQTAEIRNAVSGRKVFPCFFGSALRVEGVRELLQGLEQYCVCPVYPEEFGARVFKISRDGQGNRLTHLKVTGGSLRVKMPIGEEKADQIRIYSGGQYHLAECAEAGSICAVTGLGATRCGQGLGAEREAEVPLLEPVLTYRVLPGDEKIHSLLLKLRQLEEEIPELHIVWSEAAGELHVQVMGQVQMEILQSLIRERFGILVEFDSGSIVYKETIQAPVIGIGHFEPLRHYAEVWLLLEPGEQGSGLELAADADSDELDVNWQRLVLTHLEEKSHPGVLTGAELTDVRITLIAGRAHLKHTEGGDFRQATYRAVRQGLMQAQSVLLEPVYEFQMELPADALGRAMNDIRKMSGRFDAPVQQGETVLLNGTAPVASMAGYQRELTSYTRGRGRLNCVLKGYEPCHNSEEVIAAAAYDPESDTENPTGSVFCAHGAGFIVGWDQVEAHAHLDRGECLRRRRAQNRDLTALEERIQETGVRAAVPKEKTQSAVTGITQDEVEEIFARTYGVKPRERNRFNRPVASERLGNPEGAGPREREYEFKPREKREEYLLVDGYNIIFAWEDLRELAKTSIDGARGKLLDMLCDYQGCCGKTVIAVFDAYKVKGNPGVVSWYHNIHVVYTKEAETADQYIEKTVHELARKRDVTVATSDGLEQMIIWGQGAVRMSAKELRGEMDAALDLLRERFREQNGKEGYYPFEGLEKK